MNTTEFTLNDSAIEFTLDDSEIEFTLNDSAIEFILNALTPAGGGSVPINAILDRSGDPVLDSSGNYILSA